jgi:ferrochelatase
MRYWHPRAGEVIKEVKEYNPDHIVLLPLYPQFSTTTTGSSFNEWDSEAKRFDLSAPDTRICCYPQNTGFIKASVKLIKKEYEDAVSKNEKKPRLLLSAHGLPEYVIKGGDPYEWQCEQTAKAIIDGLAIEGLDWMQCFQSRVGPMKWTGPSTEEEIIRTAKEGLPIIIYAHAFVSEHVETLVELDIEYKMMALDNGAPYYARVPAVGVEEEFIQGLANIVLEKAGIKGENNVDRVEPCPETFGKCYLKNKENKR